MELRSTLKSITAWRGRTFWISLIFLCAYPVVFSSTGICQLRNDCFLTEKQSFSAVWRWTHTHPPLVFWTHVEPCSRGWRRLTGLHVFSYICALFSICWTCWIPFKVAGSCPSYCWAKAVLNFSPMFKIPLNRFECIREEPAGVQFPEMECPLCPAALETVKSLIHFLHHLHHLVETPLWKWFSVNDRKCSFVYVHYS